MMLNLLLFPRFCSSRFRASNRTRSNRFQTHTRCRPPVLGMEETKVITTHICTYNHTGQREARCRRFRAGFLFFVLSTSSSMLLLALAIFQIRRLAMNSRNTKSRIIWASERPLSSCKQQLCLLACSTSLLEPSRAVSIWYPHKRDQPKNASCCCRSKVRTYPAKKTVNHNAELSL